MNKTFSQFLKQDDRFNEERVSQWVLEIIHFSMTMIQKEEQSSEWILRERNDSAARTDILFERLSSMLILKTIPTTSVLNALTKNGELSNELMSKLIFRMENPNEFEDIRKLSADLISRLPCTSTMPILQIKLQVCEIF
jgi:hypothetical protein